jgi:hypothetical protein
MHTFDSQGPMRKAKNVSALNHLCEFWSYYRGYGVLS